MIMESSQIGFGWCWCHLGYDLAVGADSLDGLCDWCRKHSPSACKNAHQKRYEEAKPR